MRKRKVRAYAFISWIFLHGLVFFLHTIFLHAIFREVRVAYAKIQTFKMAGVTISEDRLKTLMKQIFSKEFEKQQKNLLNFISGNFDVTMTEIKKAQNDLNELNASLEHTKTLLEENLAKAEKEV